MEWLRVAASPVHEWVRLRGKRLATQLLGAYSAARPPGGDWESGTGLGFDVMIVLRNGGLAASPPVRYTLEMADE